MSIDNHYPSAKVFHSISDRSQIGSKIRFRYGAKAYIPIDGGVIMVRERHENGLPFWTLPGGGILADETPEESLRRELREELQCETDINDKLATLPYRHRSEDNLVSIYHVFEGAMKSEPIANTEEGVFEVVTADPSSPPDTTLKEFKNRLPTLMERVSVEAPAR